MQSLDLLLVGPLQIIKLPLLTVSRFLQLLLRLLQAADLLQELVLLLLTFLNEGAQVVLGSLELLSQLDLPTGQFVVLDLDGLQLLLELLVALHDLTLLLLSLSHLARDLVMLLVQLLDLPLQVSDLSLRR